jgi:hypothetical protein
MPETPDQKRQRRIATAPVSAQRILARAIAGTASPRQAIKAMCLECIGFDRKGITECTGYSCPLWCYRPFQPEQDDHDAEVAQKPATAS